MTVELGTSASTAMNEKASTPYLRLTQSEADPMNDVWWIDGSPHHLVRQAHVENVRSIFTSGVVDKLVEAGFVTPSTLVEVGPERRLGIRQPELGLPLAGTEVPPTMRRDAGLVLLRVEKVLRQHKLALSDADLSGITVGSDGIPKFHNLPSIAPAAGKSFGYAEFFANFVGPLKIIHKRPELIDVVHKSHVVDVDAATAILHPRLRAFIRWMARLGGFGQTLSDAYQRVWVRSPLGGLLHTGRIGNFVRAALKRKDMGVEEGYTSLLLDDLEIDLEQMSFSSVSQRWTAYYDHLDLDAIIRSGADWKASYQGKREQNILSVLGAIPKGTLLDIGANNGFFSLMGAHDGFDTTAVDSDIGAIDRLYRRLRDANSSLRVRPLVVDFVALRKDDWPRLEADAVLALGFLHHMRRVALLPWDTIAERLAGLTRKVLVTEFKPGTGAGHAKRAMTALVEDDYRLENLVSALSHHFSKVEVLGNVSAVSFDSDRTMIVCRK